jgi:hypothetical protein
VPQRARQQILRLPVRAVDRTWAISWALKTLGRFKPHQHGLTLRLAEVAWTSVWP